MPIRINKTITVVIKKNRLKNEKTYKDNTTKKVLSKDNTYISKKSK